MAVHVCIVAGFWTSCVLHGRRTGSASFVIPSSIRLAVFHLGGYKLTRPSTFQAPCLWVIRGPFALEFLHLGHSGWVKIAQTVLFMSGAPCRCAHPNPVSTLSQSNSIGIPGRLPLGGCYLSSFVGAKKPVEVLILQPGEARS